MRKVLLPVILVVVLYPFLSSCGGKAKVKELLPISKKALSDTSSIFYAHFSEYPADLSGLPIGIFDSGTGGLTILETLLSIDSYDNITGALVPDGIADFAGEDFMYFADYAHMPFADFLKHGKNVELQEIAVKDALFLMGDSYYNVAEDPIPIGIKKPVKLIVIACNTASACGFKDVDTLLNLSGTGVKVVGVINSGVRAALDGLSKDKECALGVLSAPGSISSSEYDRVIRNTANKMGFGKLLQIFIHEGDGIAESIDGVNEYISSEATAIRSDYLGPVLGEEEYDINVNLMDRYNFDFGGNAVLLKKENGRIVEMQLNSPGNYARYHLVSLIENHRRSGSRIPISSIILGSTHYPFILDTLNKVMTELYNYRRDGMYLYRNSISKDFRFVNPAEYTAQECYEILRSSGNLALKTTKSTLESFVSVPAGKDANEEVTTKIVPFSDRYLDSGTLSAIEYLVPNSFSLLRKYIN